MSNKLALVVQEEDTLVHPNWGVDISMPPSSHRASFPYPSLPPHRHLTAADILREYIHVPNTNWSILGAFVCGMSMMRSWYQPSSHPYAWRSLIVTVYGAFLYVWCKQRRIRSVDMNQMLNVSGSPKGPCHVTAYAVSVTNSHAGTHADTPFHFINHMYTFDPQHYTGTAVILDVSVALRDLDTNQVSWTLISSLADQYQVNLNEVHRLLLCTRLYDAADQHDEWVSNFAHLTVDCAQRLAALPKLVLLGIDTPSIDAPAASPIGEHAHGSLLAGEVAILENLQFELLVDSFRYTGAVGGVMITTFNPSQDFADSKGCSVAFYPDPGNLE
eukprot:PhF_6_TR40593/c0_g1_i1/m.60887